MSNQEFCVQCGENLPNTAKFCPACGAHALEYCEAESATEASADNPATESSSSTDSAPTLAVVEEPTEVSIISAPQDSAAGEEPLLEDPAQDAAEVAAPAPESDSKKTPPMRWIAVAAVALVVL